MNKYMRMIKKKMQEVVKRHQFRVIRGGVLTLLTRDVVSSPFDRVEEILFVFFLRL